jgi:arylsulfatase A-like enzyme
MNKPNIIFILADDLGWAEPGCYQGNPLNETPHIDAMAERGMRFTTAYASSTVCSPSRAGLMTGQTPPRNGITDYLRPDTEWYMPLKEGGFFDNELPEDTDYRLNADLTVLPQMFKKQGRPFAFPGPSRTSPRPSPLRALKAGMNAFLSSGSGLKSWG